VTSYAARERAELVAALRAVPENAPTLCAGWTARDLAAHLVARERRPDSTPGLLVPALARWTERVRAGYARRPYLELIDLIASGPPLTSPFALPGVDAAANLAEHLVHVEDVRRAQPGWAPRELDPAEQEAIWASLRSRGRMFFRSAPATIVLARPGDPAGPGCPDGATGEGATVAGQGPEVTITGEPLELLLYAFGRREQAVVELTGPDNAVAAVQEMKLGI
jgi:uncharacterized protein (TIGR03085 family)